MDNYAIADQLSLLAKLMDIHGENSFKAKSYASAAFALEKLPKELASMPHEKIFAVKGIGESVGKKIIELLETGEITQLKEILAQTPEGVLEMMNIKGLGPKKINTIWKELGIDTITELKKACEENVIATKKGFGEKTQQKILESILFQNENTGKYLYAQVEAFEEAFRTRLLQKFPKEQVGATGAFRRQLEVIETLEYVTTISSNQLKKELVGDTIQLVNEAGNAITFHAENTLLLRFYCTDEKEFTQVLFETSCSDEFLEAFRELGGEFKKASDEKELFRSAGLHYIPPFMREKKGVLAKAKKKDFKGLLQTKDIKGLIHSHSTWSDGAHTLEDMAAELIRLGFEYLVISDHSKAAYYANGLDERRIREQHKQIDQLNKKLHPFKIFKSIECDILNDGVLDYDDKVLSSFDLVIVSIHANLDMDEEKAMKRLLGAISNPYTTILGHMTGRRLLRRKGYPVDYKAIIEACVENNVVIEINANPQRLDMEWTWVDEALDHGVMLSVNPDAHSTEEFHNIKYGVLAAQKGGLTKERNLSSYSLKEFEEFLKEVKEKKGIA
jgi:DNA polymerase (family 10)